jgi:ribonucleoside-diphosphate reductase alpha chain
MVNVIKRDGSREELNIEKIHKVLEWACEDVTGVSVSEIELRSQIQFYNNITTKTIHETMIKATADLISEETPNYQYVAGRLINYQLRKEVYGQYDPYDLWGHTITCVDRGVYDKQIFDLYAFDEFTALNKHIDHERDFLLSYAGMEQLRGKYLVKNRVTDEFYETPQMAFMLIAMTIFSQKPKNARIKWVKDLYDALSTFDISFPTPIMAGVRTPVRQFSSCVLIETDDSLDSINATASSIVKYISQKAGIGIGAGRIRAINSPIRGGNAVHTGVLPFYRHFQTAVKSCSQGGVRGGAATLYVPLWHLEIEDILVLKNNKGTEETRLRQLDYGIQFNKVMYERLLCGGNITLFSPHDVPDLYDAFFINTDEFRRLYEKYESNKKIRKHTVKAIDLFMAFMQERKDTGRIYAMNVDHCNDHGSFVKEVAPIRMSNLCTEITLPTKALEDIKDPEGEISLCTLSAVNAGKVKKPADFEKPCTLLVHALNALLDYQDYPILAAQLSTMARRPLGIGFINLAYWIAKNGFTYQNPNLEMIHEYTEAFSYYLIKASADMAEAQGACSKSNETLYHDGILPIDTYKREVDELVAPVYKMPWEELRAQLKRTGILNSTLMTQFPAETSAQVSNSTNGVEPPRALVSVKTSKDGSLSQVVPEIHRYKNKYDLLWDQKSPIGYLSIMAVIQKFFDMAISVNTSYNPEFYENGEIPMSELLQHLIWCYKYGIKTLYYFQTNDSAGEIIIEEGELSPSENVDLDDDCDSCKV